MESTLLLVAPNTLGPAYGTQTQKPVVGCMTRPNPAVGHCTTVEIAALRLGIPSQPVPEEVIICYIVC